MIKADTPLTSAKISRMLHQLEFKLHVEKQYKEGIDKMAKLYLVDGDKKARYVLSFFSSFSNSSELMKRCAAYRADTENKRVESKQKMVLLNQALKRYKTLDVMGELGDEDDGERFSLLKSPSHQLLIHLRHRSQVSPKTLKRTCDDLYLELFKSRLNKHEISPTPLNPRDRNTLQKPSFT